MQSVRLNTDGPVFSMNAKNGDWLVLMNPSEYDNMPAVLRDGVSPLKESTTCSSVCFLSADMPSSPGFNAMLKAIRSSLEIAKDIQTAHDKATGPCKPDSPPREKPPLGIKPRRIHVTERGLELVECLRRHVYAGKVVHEAWVNEIKDIINELSET